MRKRIPVEEETMIQTKFLWKPLTLKNKVNQYEKRWIEFAKLYYYCYNEKNGFEPLEWLD